MATVFNLDNMPFKQRQSLIPEYAWLTSDGLSEEVNAKHLKFELRSLESGMYSYPYHFHRNAEEMFVILEGKAILRTPSGFSEVKTGDILFFEVGPSGAHQLYNHNELPCKYLDLNTTNGIDIAEYPDSGKINILPYREIYQSTDQVDYYKGEGNIKEIWESLGYTQPNGE